MWEFCCFLDCCVLLLKWRFRVISIVGSKKFLVVIEVIYYLIDCKCLLGCDFLCKVVRCCNVLRDVLMVLWWEWVYWGLCFVLGRYFLWRRYIIFRWRILMLNCVMMSVSGLWEFLSGCNIRWGGSFVLMLCNLELCWRILL